MRAAPGVVALLCAALLGLVLAAATGPQQGTVQGLDTSRAAGAPPAAAHRVTPLVAKRWS